MSLFNRTENNKAANLIAGVQQKTVVSAADDLGHCVMFGFQLEEEKKGKSEHVDFPIVRHVASKLNKTLSLTVLAVFCTVYTCTVQSMMILPVTDTICKDSLSLFSS